MIYDADVLKTNDSTYKVSGSGNSLTEVIIKQSNYHIIIEPNGNNFDRYLVQDVVKEYAKKVPLNIFGKKKSFKVVLINNVDNLSYYAQTSLRRTMEKFSGNCRFIMWCKSLSRVIDPIRSRCYCFRVRAPKQEEMFELLLRTATTEKIKLKLRNYCEIIGLANGSIKKLLWYLQMKKYKIPYETSYDKVIKNITELILTCSIIKANDIRNQIYNIMITNISGTKIMKDIVKTIFQSKIVNEKGKLNLAEVAAKYEHNLITGRREIIHLEAFIFGIMTVLS
jgi:replication factor C subunit 3/5